MKFCTKCGAQCEDNVAFCPSCGSSFDSSKQAAFVDIYDHTEEFDPQDVSDNKVYAMLCYLMGAVGIIIALLASNKSEYLRFHIR